MSGNLLNKLRIKVVIDSGKLILSKDNVFVGKGYACDGMFKLCTSIDNVNNKVSSSCYMLDSNSITLWHVRLAHIGFSTIKRAIKCVLIGCDNVEHDKCELCVKSKMVKKHFPSVERNSKLLDLIHSDLCELNGMLTNKA